jgi:hypothetical protein
MIFGNGFADAWAASVVLVVSIRLTVAPI